MVYLLDSGICEQGGEGSKYWIKLTKRMKHEKIGTINDILNIKMCFIPLLYNKW